MPRLLIGWLARASLVAACAASCSKKPPPVVPDAGAPEPAPSGPQITELAPIEDEAGPPDAAPDATRKWVSGPAYNANQSRIKQCCNAMRAEAVKLGTAPEASQLVLVATQCDVLATQVGPTGTAPEFNQLRQILKSIKLPAACQF